MLCGLPEVVTLLEYTSAMAFPADFSLESRDFDTTRYVYHYTTRDVALQHVLSMRKVRLGPLTKTNDPRETKSWKFGVTDTGHNLPESPRERKEEIKRLNQIFHNATWYGNTALQVKILKK